MPATMEAAPGKPTTRAAAFRARLLSTLILWGVVTAFFLSGRMGLYVTLTGFLGGLGCVEFYRLTASVPGRGCRIWALLVSLVYLVGFGWLSLRPPDEAGRWVGTFLPDVAGLALVVLGSFFLRLRHPIAGAESVYPVAMAGFAFLYVPVLFAGFLIRLGFLGVEAASVSAGFWLALLVVIATKFTDMGAYLVGSMIGKHKAIPHVSPAKSWEGYIGSLLFTQAGAFGIWWLGGEHLAWLAWGHVLALGFLIALAAMVGDLAESILKRSLKVKDSGKLLPGIGGVLDLLDSLCFAVPVAYFYLILFVLP